MFRVLLLIAFVVFASIKSFAASYNYTANKDVVGKIQTEKKKKNDTMASIARRYDVGMDELVLVNSNINPYMLMPGTVVILPTQFILPKAPRRGVVINLPEKRMYYFKGNKVLSFPVGIGKVGWATPVGKMKIISKMKNPAWTIPQAVWQEQFKYGNVLPKKIPPGPDNPLGKHALRLSKSNYLIHGTNDPSGVGQRVSAGCLRMYPEDVKFLYSNLPLNIVVTIVNQPGKFSTRNKQIVVESHPPLKEDVNDRNIEDGSDLSLPMTLSEAVDFTFDLIDNQGMEPIAARDIYAVINNSFGIPTKVAEKARA